MGTTYTNCQVRCDTPERVVKSLEGLLREPAYVAPAVNGWVGVYPEGGTTDTNNLARELSERLAVAVFDWGVYDSDVFTYSLFENGRLRDEFNSAPDYFDGMGEDDEEEDPNKIDPTRVRGDPQALLPYCVPSTTLAAIQAVLHPVALAEKDDLPDMTALMQHFPDTGFQNLARMLGTTPDTLKQTVAQKMQEKYVFADHQANDLATLLGMDEELARIKYSYIEQRDIANHRVEEFRVVGPKRLSQEYKNQKLWESDRMQDPEKMRSWLQQGADPNAHGASGESVLHRWARYCQSEKVQILLQAGADVNAVTTVSQEYGLEQGVTALMLAAGAVSMPPERQFETVRLLLAAGADVNTQSETGRTALKATTGFVNPGFERWQRPQTVEQQKQGKQVAQMLREAGAIE